MAVSTEKASTIRTTLGSPSPVSIGLIGPIDVSTSSGGSLYSPRSVPRNAVTVRSDSAADRARDHRVTDAGDDSTDGVRGDEPGDDTPTDTSE